MELIGFERNMPFREYLGDPAPEPSLTSSLAKQLLDSSPEHVWRSREASRTGAGVKNKRAFDLGTVAHAKFIGGNDEIVVIDEDSFRSAAAKEKRDEAYAQGLTPILRKDDDLAQKMANVAKREFGKNKVIGAALEGGLVELSVIWKEGGEGGIFCRCRPDVYYQDSEPPTVIHYKTTSQNIDRWSFGSYAARMGWDVIAAHYHAGLGFLDESNEVRQIFALQQTKEPYECIALELDNPFFTQGQEARDAAVRIWFDCVKRKSWPGYGMDVQVIESPAWHFNLRLMQADLPSTKEELEASAEFQDPRYERIYNALLEKCMQEKVAKIINFRATPDIWERIEDLRIRDPKITISAVLRQAVRAGLPLVEKSVDWAHSTPIEENPAKPE